ncbi:hypothetical protein [Mitsuokella sp. oral taxon 131]|uniref:hypothetical protein n=1 Tax=Mitsuokella sp. oral taxon 131 TaxID=1321780 RepID=UPI0003ADFE09|nr:hypothetical protein [Mitsuokella sp. oral taxon 131]ERL04562.1 hypothetical protein HMPREF1985_01341 [Mitsuokella sp. oral taxon 131 str. W9106]
MAARETLEKIEAMVAEARTLPFTDRILINDNDLVHYVEELRMELPKEVKRAEEIVRHEKEIVEDAQKEADRIINDAKEYATRMTEENEIVVQAKEKARAILQQAQQQEKEIMERTQANATQLQNDADTYAKQVFDQLIAHVNGTFQGVRQAETGLQQALAVLQQAKEQMNGQSHSVSQPMPVSSQAQSPAAK